MSNNSLENYMLTTFSLAHHHHWSISEIENLMPWELGIYISMLQSYLDKENQRLQNQNG